MTIYTDHDTIFGRAALPRRGSSLRHRRFVVGGYVIFDPVALARPSMRPREIDLLSALLRRAERVLEFGAGGSTTLAVKLGVSRLVSVESDASWIARIKDDDAAARAHEDGRLTLLHADIGPIGALGGPDSKGAREKWPNYARAPWGHVGAEDLDLVLIDGRFRIACILETALRANRRSLIAIHDFWNRPEYHVVLPFLDEVERCETLGVFRIKAGMDHAAARTLLAEALNWPR
jgi:hypothetical protein